MDRYRMLPSYHYKNNEDGLLTESVGKPLRDYKIYGNLAYDGLPIEYQRVEYIESTGTQYIKTGVCPAVNPGFEITFLTKNSLSTSGYGCIFGVRSANKYAEFQLSTYSEGNNSGMLRRGSNEYDAGLVANEKITVTLVNGTYSNSNGVEIESTTGSASADTRLCVFALNNNGSITQYGKVQLYSLRLYLSGSIVVRDFIPCYRKSDGEIGLYDLVGQRFYTNDGTGVFLKGGNVYQSPNTEDLLVPSEYQQVDYVETTGGQYININYVPKGKLTVEGKISLPQPTKEAAIMGTENYGWELGFPSSGNRMFSYLSTVSSISINPTTSIYDTLLEFTAVNDYDGGYRSLSLNLEDSFIDSNNVDSSYKQNLLLFDYRKTYPFVGKCYGIKIYDNDILVRNFVPCYRKSDGAIGMYDSVSGVFHTNQGSGVFLKGEEVIYTSITHTSVGDYVGNIFDYDTVTKNSQAEKVTIDGEKCYKSQRLTANLWAVFRTNMSGMQDGKKYTISFDIWADIETGFTNNYVFINNATIPRHTLTKITIERQNITTTFTYRANTGAEWLHLYFEYIPENIMYISNVSIIPCEPYKIPITSRGKNISPFSQPTAVVSGLTTTITSDTIEFDGDGTNDGRCWTPMITLPAGTYTITMTQISGADSMKDTYEAFYLYKESSWTILAQCYLYKSSKNAVTFTIAEDTKVRLSIYNRGGQIFYNYKVRYQITKGHTPDYNYEPNRGSVTENIYLSKPLSRCGAYGVDYIDFKAQKVVWNTGEYALTGDEEWQNLYGESLFGCYNLVDDANWQPMLSTHYIYNGIQSGLNAGMANNEFAYQTADKKLYFKDTRFTTVDEWKEWLSRQYESRHPVIVRYTLATPIEEPITLPKPLTNIDTCVIDIDTQVPPSKTEYQYYKGGN